MERKSKIYKYYAIKRGASFIIQRSFTGICKSLCTLTVPKLPSSPNYLDTGAVNKGITIVKVCYTGGEVAGILPKALFNQKVVNLVYAVEDHCVRLTPPQKKIVKELLLNQ
jgi:hypothetical protein